MHTQSLEATYKMAKESTEDFAVNFKNNYVNTYLPSWMALELVTFTHLSKLYDNLRDSSAKTEIAGLYGVNTPILQSTTGTDDVLDDDVDSLAPGQTAT